MELEFSENTIVLNKELNALDDFVISFCKKLDKHKVKYVLVSGYIAIVFGRSRATEDIDILVEKMPAEKFYELWKDLTVDFECFNADGEQNAYNDFLVVGDAIRFSRPQHPMPNVEFKFAETFVEKYTLENALNLKLNRNVLRISPLEIQIAYKLYLGSEKDIEDAMHLYRTLHKYLDRAKLSNCFVLLKIPRSVVDLLD